jgi:hypothetical protein
VLTGTVLTLLFIVLKVIQLLGGNRDIITDFSQEEGDSIYITEDDFCSPKENCL